ncbi:MAG: FadR family transcriptional regulator [Proteobacteria bacterium]|nr:FadR family transcriptional regulator [Pseudomonadota bacterium]MBU1582481.1 FadR family transcriptional regulator [Pseudomonadota bacterium]
MFAEIQQNTITQQIIRQIHTAIIAGKLSPGDKLPSENDLVKQFAISKQTLRESLRALEHMGLIESKKGTGGGSFVIEVDAAITKLGLLNYFYFKNLSIKDLSMVRKLIEPFSAKLAAQTMSDEDVMVLKELNASAKKHIKADNYEAAIADEIALHTKIAEQTNNPLIVLLMEFVEDILVDYKKVFQVGIDELEVILQAHDKIYEAIKDKDGDRAFNEMLSHIEALEESLWTKEKNLSLKEVYSKTTTYNYNK